MPSCKTVSSCLLASVFLAGTLSAADWPQWGGSPQRNNAPDAKNIPHQWNVGKFDRKTGDWLNESAENILFVARLGSQSYGTPVLSGGKVYCATNNGAGYLERYPAEVDLGCLLCFAQSDGRFLWQLSREKLASGEEADRDFDWPLQGICSVPLVEGDRLWIVTNRGEVACVDTEGFADDENDGPYRSETSTAAGEADVVWYFDMMARLGIRQHNMCSCSVTAAGDLLLVNTGNAVDASEEKVPAPQAPSFIALDKHTGELLWADNSPGENILHGQWSSPAFAVLGGVPQAIFPGADGWIYSFLAEKTEDGKPKLLWKFDCNPKRSVWEGGGMGERSNIIATPVVHDGLVYIATGQDPEHGEGQGHLWCIDPTRRGDVSPELVLDQDGKPVPPRRTEAIDESAGEVLQANPNSAAVWHYTGHDANEDGRFDFEETMHRTIGMVAVKDGLLVIADMSGLVHCLDAKTGRLHWTYDTLAAVWGSPLVVDGKIFIGDEDGEMCVFELSPEQNLLAENYMGASIYSSAVAVDNVLYVATRTHLIAIAAKKDR
ncbi:MAG TPA: PQQ-binding-like beta-propeller repeat protein [Thermoguttaceae bacterium]|nr:PQQ-binding-like beta-propeller repeat protein [Thermoguttaceae bacterium]